MATPALSRSPVQSRDVYKGRQLDLLSAIWSPPAQERENAGTFALSFSPDLVRYLVHRFSRPGDTVLDCFLGSGTTMLESLLMGRVPVGADCNEDAVEGVRRHLLLTGQAHLAGLHCADARSMGPFLPDESVDLIVTQPPYGSTHKFSKNNPHDLSLLPARDFLQAIEGVAEELFRVLKADGVCALVIGDIKDRGRMMPLGFQFVHRFLSRGFSVKDIYDHRTPTAQLPVPLHEHEYLFIFQKKQKAPKRPR